jgi:hypothetical protein
MEGSISAYTILIKSLQNKMEQEHNATTKTTLTSLINNWRNNHKKSTSNMHTTTIEHDSRIEINVNNICKILEHSKLYFHEIYI